MGKAKKELLSGIIYTAVTKYSGIIINIIVTAFLARMLPPSDFGVVAIASVLIHFFSMLSDMGLGPAIIQKKDLGQQDLRSIFTLSFYIGLILTVIFFFSSHTIANYYDNEKLITITQIFSIAVFFHCLDVVPNSLLKKAKRFRFIAVRNIIVNLIGGTLAILAAYHSFGVYSLLIQPILSSIILFILDYQQNILHLVSIIQRESIKKIFSFSIYQFMFSFINYFSRNLDILLGGKVFGIKELGYYEKSYTLMVLPVKNLSHIITPAIQPIFSEYQNDESWLFTRSMALFKVLLFIGFPLTAFLFFSSEEIIILFLGNQWYGAVPIFKILSLSVGIQIIYSPQGAFFQSANAVKKLFSCGLVTAFLSVSAVLVGCFILHSITGMAWLIVIAYFFAFLNVYYVMVKKVFHQKFSKFLSIMIEPLLYTFLLFVLLFVFDSFSKEWSLITRLIIKILIYFSVMISFELKTKLIRGIMKK